MKLHRGHRVVIALTGLAIGLRVLMPIYVRSSFGPRVDPAATLLQVIGILLIGVTLVFILPVVWNPAAPRRLASAGFVLAWFLTTVVFVFVASKTGVALSLERTNWLLTSVGAVVLLLLIGLSWGFVRRSLWRGLRVGLVSGLLVVLVGTGLSVAQQSRFRRLAELRQEQEAQRRQAEAMRTRIIEGERIGLLPLGISVDEVRAMLGRTFSSAERIRTGLVQYDWYSDNPEAWSVLIEPKTGHAVGISLSGTFEWDPQTNHFVNTAPKLSYETTKGVRFVHSPQTVSAVYGSPSKAYTFDYGRVSYYYAPVRTEFEFSCRMKAPQQTMRCKDFFRSLSALPFLLPDGLLRPFGAPEAVANRCD